MGDPDEYDVGTVLRHRKLSAKRGLEFLVKWHGYPMEEATWEKIPAFLPRFCDTWREYCVKHGLLPELM